MNKLFSAPILTALFGFLVPSALWAQCQSELTHTLGSNNDGFGIQLIKGIGTYQSWSGVDIGDRP